MRCVHRLFVAVVLAGCGAPAAPVVEPAPAAEPEEPVAAAPTEIGPCPGSPGGEEQVRLYLRLTELDFVLAATDGTLVEMPYDGDEYPLEALREHVEARRRLEPDRRQLFVTAEPELPPATVDRAVAIARETFPNALQCIPAEEDQGLALGALMGDQIGSNFGFGGLGLRGTGGRGESGQAVEPQGPPPGARISPGNVDVRGSLSAEVIRRVVARHIEEVRVCYQQELAAAPDLAGRVLVSFVIGTDGNVQSAAVGASTLDNARLEGCIVEAVRRWTFPAPDGGVVGVNYPFVLSPE